LLFPLAEYFYCLLLLVTLTLLCFMFTHFLVLLVLRVLSLLYIHQLQHLHYFYFWLFLFIINFWSKPSSCSKKNNKSYFFYVLPCLYTLGHFFNRENIFLFSRSSFKEKKSAECVTVGEQKKASSCFLFSVDTNEAIFLLE